MAVIACRVVGTETSDQELPPSLVPTEDAVPLAWHACVEPQLTLSTDPWSPEGCLCNAHVAPPSMVRTTDCDGESPTATHTRADGQEMALNWVSGRATV
jgi:hypothetical protein